MAGPNGSNVPHVHILLSADGTDGDKVGHSLVVSMLRRARHFTPEFHKCLLTTGSP